MKAYHPTLAEIIDESGELNEAEARFVDCCKTGEIANFGNELPTEATNVNTIHASLIRLAVLGGCEGMLVRPKGVQIRGHRSRGYWICRTVRVRFRCF